MITSMGHDPATNTLEVEFNTGMVYRYSNVDHAKYMRIISHPSVGTAFHNIIKTGGHPFIEVDRDEDQP